MDCWSIQAMQPLMSGASLPDGKRFYGGASRSVDDDRNLKIAIERAHAPSLQLVK